MTSLHVIYGLVLPPIQNPGICLYIKLCAICSPETGCMHLNIVDAPLRAVAHKLQRCKAAKYTLHCLKSKLSLVWRYGMEYGKKF